VSGSGRLDSPLACTIDLHSRSLGREYEADWTHHHPPGRGHMNANSDTRQSSMAAPKDDRAYVLTAIRALQSDDPTIRRPAVSMLLELARQGHGAARADAERVLTEEFGPYAVCEGLSGCSAPIEVVHTCDGNCRACVWLWHDPPSLFLQHGWVLPAELDSQSDNIVGRPACKAVA
jgi:hypothetical protein